ncbi:hypothetical protein SprV_0200861600 [Sparganum proliferum]
MTPIGPPMSKPSTRIANLSCFRLATPTPNRLHRVHDINGHSRSQQDLLDISGPTAAPGTYQPFSPPTSPSPPTLATNVDRHPEPPLPSSSSSSSSSSPPSSTASTSTDVMSSMPINTTHNPDTPTNANTTTTTTVNTSNEDLVYTCPHCDHTFTSHIGLVGYLRTHRTETGEPVPEASAYTRRIRLPYPHCPRTLMYRMGLSGHMRIHESGIDRSPDTSSTPTVSSPAHTPPPRAPTATCSITLSTLCTPTMLSPTRTPSPSAPTIITEADTDTDDFSCPHCPRTFISRIGLIGRLRIPYTETGEPVPGASAYIRRIRRIRRHYQHCIHTVIHRIGLLGHMRVHENLR